MRSCCSPSSLREISRAAWRHAVAGIPSLTGGSHHQQQHDLRYLPLRPPSPPNAPGLAERLFSSSSTKRSTKKSAAKKDTPVNSASGGDPFYVVRKGDVIGIYKNLADCQAQVSNSVCDPSVSVFKGYSLRKETEEYLAARGLKNALYSFNAADARDELFDDLALCPFQHPDGNATSTLERPQEMETKPSKKHPKVAEQKPLPDSHLSCILEFDGACKGNPGKSGAGVIVRRPDGSLIAQLREGLGIATCNAAEYHALLLGLRYAAKEGFKYIRVQGDSMLVCNQAQGLWRPKSDNMADLCKKVKQLKRKFVQIQINHVLREFNSDADAQANLAVELPVGGIQEQSNIAC
ncbi:uncharacterized protein [Lolium perenne]|uniref:uncharacterized protein isoform X2 n=1 Tax=Lolium perenne TaxID=4522 RepID=UPI0021F52F51|nr:uncharacterized protein LOC127340821 isoform X3 [Lolium perenne]XP_051222536.1 uncharacterized protein LOC127340821 isoform X4 [Lolium perenne]